MATGISKYTRTEEYIGVRLRNPSFNGDVERALEMVKQDFGAHHGRISEDSITVRADEEHIYFEFRGSVSEAVRDDG